MHYNINESFRFFQAQTTPHPMGIEVSYAKGNYIYDKSQKAYLDMVAGVSACNVGHSHPVIIEAIKEQAEKHLHVMVYGEFCQEKPLELCRLLDAITPPNLTTTYLTNSGTEAIEGAIKLAKRYTNRAKLVSCQGAYHGSTHGSLSLMGNQRLKRKYYPLLPKVEQIELNNLESLDIIDSQTAAVVLETIQGSAGFLLPTKTFMQALSARCKEVGALLILDEIQPAFGRTGTWFAFEHYGIVPDILVIGKALGAGLPVGAFMAHHSIMQLLSENPALGHITTFGGNALIAASCVAHLHLLKDGKLMGEVEPKERYLRDRLAKIPAVEQVRGKGLMLMALLPKEINLSEVVNACLEQGVIFFYLLFEKQGLRITPPLTISIAELERACEVLEKVLEELTKKVT